MTARPLIAALVLLAAPACGQRGGEAAFAVRDSAGIAVAESSAPAWGDVPAWRLAREPAVDIGAADGAPETEFYAVRGAARLSDGRIVVADGGSSTVRWYAPDGAFLFQRGGEGSGPQEFANMRRATLHRLDGDTVAVVEGERVARFDGAGSRSDALAPGLASMGGVVPLGEGRWAGSGTFDFMAMESGERRDTFPLLVTTEGSAAIDTVGRIPGPYRVLNVGTDGGGAITSVEIHQAAFSGGADLAAWEGTILVAPATEHGLRHRDPDGTLRRIVRWRGPDLAITGTDRQAWIEATVANRLNAPGNPLAGDEAAVRRGAERTPFPAEKPAYREVRADPAGNAWVELDRLIGDDVERHLVLDPVGRLLGEVVFPERFRTLEVGADYVLGVWRDELDVEHVRLYVLEKS
ncbi:MAG: hypothetical protein WEB88_09720 [Gemmatimonadota bacterium]